MQALPWSRLYRYRKQVARRFGTIWGLPIRKRYHQVLAEHGRDAMRVLEIGAGDRGLERRLLRQWPQTRYRSFDIDREQPHDYYSLQEIRGEYDLVCMFEVIEHLPAQQAMETLERAFAVLAAGGLLMLTTPNTYCPPNYLRDATHITPWCYDELGGIARIAGFEVRQIYRLYHDPLLMKLVRRFLFFPIHYSLRIDFAKQIMLVAAKPRQAGGGGGPQHG